MESQDAGIAFLTNGILGNVGKKKEAGGTKPLNTALSIYGHKCTVAFCLLALSDSTTLNGGATVSSQSAK